jgi:transposase-like protein
LYAWVRQARAEHGNVPWDAFTTGLLEELRRLGKEVKELRRERNFRKNTAAYVAEWKK